MLDFQIKGIPPTHPPTPAKPSQPLPTPTHGLNLVSSPPIPPQHSGARDPGARDPALVISAESQPVQIQLVVGIASDPDKPFEND